MYTEQISLPVRQIRPLQILSFFSLIMLGSVLFTCSPKTERRFAEPADILFQKKDPVVKDNAVVRSGIQAGCDASANYIPDTNFLDHTPVKYLRLNFHFVNTTDSAHNYVGEEARRKVREILGASLQYLEQNEKMWLPLNNDTPVLPTRYRYVLTGRPDDPRDDGIYFHFDDELAYYVHKGHNRNLQDRRIIDKYGVQLDTVLNVFLMPHHPDSVESATYNPGRVGVALGSSVKIAGLFSSGSPGWSFSGVLNHEVGHVLGLSHSWGSNDGCDDTPQHPNCWNRTDTPPCDTMVSNNVMDYTAFQRVWTPCQIGRIHSRLARENDRVRKLCEPRWCILDPDHPVTIRGQVTWEGARDLESDLIIEDGGRLIIKCRVSLPENSKITILPGGVLILDDARLHNACGNEWQGIELVRSGRRQGELIFLGSPQLEDMANPVKL